MGPGASNACPCRGCRLVWACRAAARPWRRRVGHRRVAGAAGGAAAGQPGGHVPQGTGGAAAYTASVPAPGWRGGAGGAGKGVLGEHAVPAGLPPLPGLPLPHAVPAAQPCRVPLPLLPKPPTCAWPYTLQSWRHLHTSREQRRAAALAARRRVEMGQLRRLLHAWRQQCGHNAAQAALRRAAVQLQRSLLQRCWREWRRLCELRWWKLQLEARDQQLRLLGSQVSGASWEAQPCCPCRPCLWGRAHPDCPVPIRLPRS